MGTGFESDLQFVESMVSEQSVFPLPGMCFNIKNYFRIVLTVPQQNMVEACDRIEEFCRSHYCYPTAIPPTTTTSNHMRSATESSDLSDITMSSASSSEGHSLVNSDEEEEELDDQFKLKE